jgi:hypothetical protein
MSMWPHLASPPTHDGDTLVCLEDSSSTTDIDCDAATLGSPGHPHSWALTTPSILSWTRTSYPIYLEVIVTRYRYELWGNRISPGHARRHPCLLRGDCYWYCYFWLCGLTSPGHLHHWQPRAYRIGRGYHNHPRWDLAEPIDTYTWWLRWRCRICAWQYRADKEGRGRYYNPSHPLTRPVPPSSVPLLISLWS